MKKYTFLRALGGGLILGLLATASAPAQPSTVGPTPTPAPDPAAVPLDGGASLLLASGVAFGLRKMRDRRRAH